MSGRRVEKDSLGEVRVPEDAYYGAQTQRAVENFPVSGRGFSRPFIEALGMIKKHAAGFNREAGLLEDEIGRAVVLAAEEVEDGRLDRQFVVDIFQTGSGTSTNMNANEVIAGRANEILTSVRGGRSPVHPNDHVNLGQSSNDVIPTALHIAALLGIRRGLLPALTLLQKSLSDKAEEFSGVRKIGRTHLMDAVAVTLGREFRGYARQVNLGVARLGKCQDALAELALGGTAVGTGLNTHHQFASGVIARLAQETGAPFIEAVDHFEAQGARDASVEASGQLKTVAVSLSKIANDIRWLGSGPRFGLAEINLPALQPGSSIMPGKVNPVIPEVVIQAAAQAVGNDAAVTAGGLGGYFELNTMLPLITRNLLESIQLLGAAARLLAEKCVDGITVNKNSPNLDVERSLSLATNLAPALGYDQAARIAKRAHQTGRNIRETVLEEGLLDEERLNTLLGRKP